MTYTIEILRSAQKQLAKIQNREQGSRKEIIPQYGAGFGFVTQAHPSAHIGICGGGWNAGDGPTDKQDEELFLSEAPRSHH